MKLTRLLRLVLALTLLGATLVPAAAPAGAQPADDPRFYVETSYRIDNDAFYDFFQKRGGIRTFGYPVSRTFRLLGLPVQIFQRTVMQLQPNGSVGTLNLLDAGLMPYTRINQSTFPAPDPAVVAASPSPNDPEYAERIVEFINANAPNVFEGDPVNFGQTFNTTVRYEDAYPNGDGPESVVPLLNLELWGAPTSRPQRDPNNANFVYLRFQRGIMHYDRTTGATQGLLLADYLKSILTGQNLPPDLEAQARSSPLYRQYAPGQPNAVARPADLPGTDLTNAFERQQQGVPGASPGVQPSAPTFGYGVQAHLWYYGNGGKERATDLVKGAGLNWIKQQVEWTAIETAPGQFDWSQVDEIVNAANASGLKVLLSVVNAPAFYRSPSSGLMPADPAQFGRLMQTMAARYRGRVAAYELWNEQNLDREAGTGNVDPAKFLPLLRAGYQGTKAGDPNALAMLGATSPTGANIPGVSMDDVDYLRGLYAVNGGEAKQYFDAVGAHPSGFSTPPDCTPETPQCSLSGGFNNHPSFFAFTRVSQYYDVMVQNGDGDKKIWFTEFGYCSNPTPPPGYEYCRSLSEQQQAEFLVRAMQKARDLPYVGGMLVWNLNYQISVPQTDEKWGFGLLRSDWSPRRAYTALAQMPKR